MKEQDGKRFNWIFFAVSAKPTSLRRALAERIGQEEKVVIIDLAVSVRQERSVPRFLARTRAFLGNNIIHYRPLHFPEKFLGIGKIFNGLNEMLTQREIDQLLPPKLERIVCYDSPAQYSLVKKFRERLSVYLAIDDRTLTVWGDPINGESEAEGRLLAKVDQVICVSKPLARTLKARTPEGRTLPIYVLPNGYDERIFDPRIDHKEPSPLKNIQKPRVLISGHVSDRMDWDGIAAASRLCPEWTWVFLGPADPGMENKIRYLLGPRAVLQPPISVDAVPAWISHSDICAVPYRLNEFSLKSHPLKAIEYLAMGRPVLSTRIPALKKYGGAIEWVIEGKGESYAKVLENYEGHLRDRKLFYLRQKAVARDSLSIRADQFKRMVLYSSKKNVEKETYDP